MLDLESMEQGMNPDRTAEAPTRGRQGALRRSSMFLAPLAAAALAWSTPASACSVCNCGDPLVAVADGHGRGGDFRLGLDTEYLTQESGSEDEPGVTDVLDQYTVRLTGVYSPAESINLVVTLPFARKRMVMDHPDGLTMPMSDVSGFGDAEVAARWFVYNHAEVGARRRQALALTLGTSLPTGRTGARDESGALVDQHGQIGTGAFGPIAGVTWRLQQDPWSLTAALTGRLRTENAESYRFGNALLWTVQGQWSPRGWLALGLALEGRNVAQDTDAAGPVANTGGLVLAVTPSAYLNVGGGLWLTARAQLPVMARLVGEQTVGPTVLAGLAWQVD
jgi:hypothetical protein